MTDPTADPTLDVYRPSSLGERAAAPERFAGATAAGSTLEVGPRVAFSGRWIGMRVIPQLVFQLAFFALLIGVHLIDDPFRALGILLPCSLGYLALALPFNLSALLGRPPHLKRPSVEDAEEIARWGIVELTFHPRLPVHGGERLDTADDVGVLAFRDGRLCFEGDRVRLSLARDDVSATHRLSRRSLWASGNGPYTRLFLEVPLAGQEAFELNVRSELLTSRTRKLARRLQEAVELWFADG